ncbi:uncharacterized protein [Asterias amurensis]|uniref:uncharacterized protein isoform X2 n=1 Tax=Asterias amurensis TaxID=7602 RepID=UPI003AB7263F
MPAIDSDKKWLLGLQGMGAGVLCMPPPTRSLPSSPPRIQEFDKMSLSAMLGEFHKEEINGDLFSSSALPTDPVPCLRAMGETIEMTNDILDLTKPLPWDRLKRGASTMSLDSLNENYMESVPGETATLDDQDKTPVATCTCGKTTNFECWLHRLPFGEAGELTDEITQTCLQLVRELRSEPSGCDKQTTDQSKLCGALDQPTSYNSLSPSINHLAGCRDTPCSWKRDRVYSDDLSVDADTPSSGSLASVPSIQRSDIASSPESYELLYKSFEVATQMERFQLERGQSEGSSIGSSLESLNRTSPKLQKVLSQKRRSSPDGSGESPADITGFDMTCIPGDDIPSPKYDQKALSWNEYSEDYKPKDLHPGEDAAQKVTFALLAKKKKKSEVAVHHSLPTEVTHWTELVSGTPKREEPNEDCSSSRVDSHTAADVPKSLKRPQSLPIQLRHIQKPSSRPQQTPEQTQGVVGAASVAGMKGVTRTLSAPEGFGFPRSAGSGQESSSTKPASQSTTGISQLTRKRQYQSLRLQTPQRDPTRDQEGSSGPKIAAGSPLINGNIHCLDGGLGSGDMAYPYGSQGDLPRRFRVPVLAMDINANFTEPQEQDTFIPEHHHFIPQDATTTEAQSLQRESPINGHFRFLNSSFQDRLHFQSDVGAQSSSDWVPGPRTTWSDVDRRRSVLQPPRTLDLIQRSDYETQPERSPELQTCTRGCSTDSPPAIDSSSFLKDFLRNEVDSVAEEKQPIECRDVGVSTDNVLSGFVLQGDQCQCAKIQNCASDVVDAGRSKSTEIENKNNEANKSKVSGQNKKSEVKSDTKVPYEKCKSKDQLRPNSTKRPPGVKNTKTIKKDVPKAVKESNTLSELCEERSIQSWRIGGKGRRGSRTTVTCEESRLADALTSRVVKIKNVGASTLSASSDKRYIRHQPLKPIKQVDAEYRQRKGWQDIIDVGCRIRDRGVKLLQKLYSNDGLVPAPLPPTVTAWPGLTNSMHSRADRVHSLPSNLNQYRSQTNSISQSQASSLSTSAQQPIKRILSWESGSRRRDLPDFDVEGSEARFKQRPLSLDVTSNYDGSATDCLPPQEMQVSPREGEDEVDLVQKKALVTSVETAVEHILSHFAQCKARSVKEKGQLGSTTHSPDVGHLMLHYLCPAIRAILLDGLRPHMSSFFVGRFKTTIWNAVEATTQLGPGTRPLYELVRQLTQLAFLKTSDLKFNAFVMGLLNIRCLELWLEHIREHPDIVRRLYEPNAFLSLCNGATKTFFNSLLLAVQPLTLLPFDLDYKFEHQGIEKQQIQQREKQQLMELYSGKTSSSSTLMTRSHAPQGGSWLKGTANLLWKSMTDKPKTQEPTLRGAMTSKGQRSFERTKNSRSSGQPDPGLLKTDENTTPTRGVESTKDLSMNKEAANNWSLDWIKGFVAASTDATTSYTVVSSSKTMTSSGSSWSRFGSSLSKALDRISNTSTSQSSTQPNSPNRTPEKEPTVRQDSSRKMGSPTSPVSPGSPVKARCHHVTMSEDELSFTKGSIMTVKEQVDPDWLMCSQGDQSGLVHIDYVQGME